MTNLMPTNEEAMTQLLTVYKNLDDAALRGMRTILMEESVMRLESALTIMQDENKKLKRAFENHKEEVLISLERTEEVFNEHGVKIEEHDMKIEQLKDEILLNSKEQGQLQKAVSKRAYKILEEAKYYNYFKEYEGQPVKDVVRKVYPRAYSSIKRKFEVGSYKDIQRIRLNETLAYINNWYPVLY